jgi:hypothetical protein
VDDWGDLIAAIFEACGDLLGVLAGSRAGLVAVAVLVIAIVLVLAICAYPISP